MRGFTILNLLATACFVAARSPQHVGKSLPNVASRVLSRGQLDSPVDDQLVKRAAKHLNSKTKSTPDCNSLYVKSLTISRIFCRWHKNP